MEKSLEWAAGLFEGEGCITEGGRHRAPRLMLKMTDEDVVRDFHKAVGGLGKVYPIDHSPHKPTWDWVVNRFEHVQAIIAWLWPWLNTRRRAKAVEVLTAHKARWAGYSNTPKHSVCTVCGEHQVAKRLCGKHYQAHWKKHRKDKSWM